MSSVPFVSLLPDPDAATTGNRDYFSELGVRPVINAAGTYTLLTASLMRPEVMNAISYAARRFVRLNDLHDAVGRRIAQLIGCEAAMVSAGAAAALTVGTAACITGNNPDLIRRIPDLAAVPGAKTEVIIQKSHRYGYDHAVRNCGVRMIEIESVAELEQAVNERTASLHFFCDAELRGRINAPDFAALGKKHNIPTFADAADVLPPTGHLSKYTKMGFALVAFSGGKGLRGPQSAGLLLGRRDLIAAARLNSSPNGDAIGRGMKVSKEDMLGMMVAVEVYLQRDATAEWQEWERRAHIVANSIAAHRIVTTEIHVPPIANHVPHVRIRWDKAALPVTAEEVRQQLRQGTPAIEIVPDASPATEPRQEILIGVWQLQPGEVEIVARRLREVFHIK